MFDKSSWIRFLYSVLVAMFITMGVLLTDREHSGTILLILKGMLAGAVIWFSGEMLFQLCEKLYPKSFIPGFILLFLLILGGTALFGCLLGIERILQLIMICLVSEVCGMGISVFYWRKYTKELNRLLEKKKQGLE